ncbi:MAG: hypothetical protein CME05_07275 [Gemmatimonadaceae bacterium]|nr:hypothetical protein [Gemmatimonadaceae bacterium]
MDSTDDAQVSPHQTFRQVRRALEDLVLFEGRQFIVPDQVSEQIGADPRPPREDVSAQQPAPELGAPAPAVATGRVTSEAASALGGGELASFRQQICECTKCELGHTRQRFVFGSGDPKADVLFVGEAPGADEDRAGEPFVGAAGQLLTKIIEAMGMKREDVFICNVLKCRPPNNRDPLPEEVASCEPYLKEQIRMVAPKVICCLGKFASQALLRSQSSLSRMRGQQHEYEGIPLVVTYHPAALLRNAAYKRDTWEDVKWVRRIYDGVEL